MAELKDGTFAIKCETKSEQVFTVRGGLAVSMLGKKLDLRVTQTAAGDPATLSRMIKRDMPHAFDDFMRGNALDPVLPTKLPDGSYQITTLAPAEGKVVIVGDKIVLSMLTKMGLPRLAGTPGVAAQHLPEVKRLQALIHNKTL